MHVCHRSLQLKTHHEWYFLLWRCTFPLLTLLLVVGVSALGRLGGVVGYALSAGPVWFYCMLIVLATPFLLMFRFPNFHPGMVTTFWKVLFLCSAFISVIEVFVWTGGKSQYAHHHHHHGSSMMGQRKLSWLLGNLLFGIVGFIGVPFFFSLQPRVRIDSSEVQDDAAAALVSLPTSPSGFNPHAGMAGKMARPSAAALGLVLLITVCAYFPIKKPSAPARANAVDVYWGLAYLLSPMFLVWLVVHTRETIHGGEFNLVVLFTVVLTHVPLFVGHLSLALFSVVDHHPTPVAKLAISCLFLGLMQLYFYVVTKVIQGFAPPYTHPSLLYVGQLYFYVFWYLLVGSDGPIDVVYFAMLALSNLHVVMANTGIYTDTVHTLSVSCWQHPTTQFASV
ncbi:hypothetical protein DYB31_009164 [Aphanomyces astaci]|uniref:Uncharacterized protein n=3 Tax=Aphanomyces astaci TaxID=112090 RepID=A0A397FBA0_APHAT|nr:hypothetical protein DYB31_009164 [Aphanomyces astaci]